MGYTESYTTRRSYIQNAQSYTAGIATNMHCTEPTHTQCRRSYTHNAGVATHNAGVITHIMHSLTSPGVATHNAGVATHILHSLTSPGVATYMH